MSITATNQFLDVTKKLWKTENQLNEYLEDLSSCTGYYILIAKYWSRNSRYRI
jgi:hypothetical protein